MNATKAEILCKWYLRFNGYFIIDNFIIHDASRVSKDTIGNVSEVDLLGIRHQYSREIVNGMIIQNDLLLIGNAQPAIDFVIGEVKTGNSDKPNPIWKNKDTNAISYLIRLSGLVETDQEINIIAAELVNHGIYTSNNNSYRIHLVLFFENQPNKNWRHVSHISLDHIIDFLLTPRGTCWVNVGVGINSIHRQWEPLINSIFEIANDMNLPLHERKNAIVGILN